MISLQPTWHTSEWWRPQTHSSSSSSFTELWYLSRETFYWWCLNVLDVKEESKYVKIFYAPLQFKFEGNCLAVASLETYLKTRNTSTFLSTLMSVGMDQILEMPLKIMYSNTTRLPWLAFPISLYPIFSLFSQICFALSAVSPFESHFLSQVLSCYTTKWLQT